MKTLKDGTYVWIKQAVCEYLNRHKLLIFAIIFAIIFPLYLFAMISDQVIEKEISVFDNVVYNFISKFISKDITDLMKFITFLGSNLFLICVAVLILIVLWRNKKYSFYGYMIALNLLLSSLLNETIKLFFQRPRPDILRLIEISGYSFPSGHSMIVLSFYGFIIFLCLKHFKHRLKYYLSALLAIMVLAIGVSRIYLGVHFASDVIAGFLVGFAWLVIFANSSIKLQRILKGKVTQNNLQ